MNIDTELNEYISVLSFDEKKLVLDLIKNLRSNSETASINKQLITYNIELDDAVRRVKNGEYIEHDEVLKEAEEW